MIDAFDILGHSLAIRHCLVFSMFHPDAMWRLSRHARRGSLSRVSRQGCRLGLRRVLPTTCQGSELSPHMGSGSEDFGNFNYILSLNNTRPYMTLLIAGMSSSVATSTVTSRSSLRPKGQMPSSNEKGEAPRTEDEDDYDRFFWTYTEEPHKTRRQAIIKAHPEVRHAKSTRKHWTCH